MAISVDALLGIFFLFSMWYVARLAYARPAEFESWSNGPKIDRKSLVDRAWIIILMCSSFLGCGWCLYWGIVKTFWFIPQNYEGRGVWGWTGHVLAFLIAVFGAYACACVLKKLAVSVLNERELLRRMYGEVRAPILSEALRTPAHHDAAEEASPRDSAPEPVAKYHI